MSSDPNNYRDVCWDLDQRGGVGETILHLCLLMATSIHADLAKRLLKFYPKLINDVYLSEEYYGESQSVRSLIKKFLRSTAGVCTEHTR